MARTFPADPFMLLSVVNMLLRDQYPSLDELCVSEDIDRDTIVKRLGDAGFEYIPAINQFR